MYSGPLNRVPFQPDPTLMQHQARREEYSRKFLEKEDARQESALITPDWKMPKDKKMGIDHLLEILSPEDSALVSLIVFLLCDNTDNDVVLLGILLYVLLSK